MDSSILRLENISKYYHLGKFGSGRFRDDIKLWWDRAFSANGRNQYKMDRDDLFCALKNVSFEIPKGEVLGIIGNNGAGKSTLLKIISRITAPTSGSVMGNGRVASLLEIGTGFHGELTGRENIFLNGTIIGMKKHEIERRFDEIVSFSGIEKFIDTPVKRYSSGMYTRLAFSVAAHMDTEILILDEVLSVGDVEFQRQCLKKISDISSKKDSTILFVSHNMQSIQKMCDRVVALHRGEIVHIGDPDTVINGYLNKEKKVNEVKSYDSIDLAPGNSFIKIKKVELVPQYLVGQDEIDVRTPLMFCLEFWNLIAEKDNSIVLSVKVFRLSGECIFEINSLNVFNEMHVKGKMIIPGGLLNDGSYFISLLFMEHDGAILFNFESCLSFDVDDYRGPGSWKGEWQGSVRPNIKMDFLYGEVL